MEPFLMEPFLIYAILVLLGIFVIFLCLVAYINTEFKDINNDLKLLTDKIRKINTAIRNLKN